MQITFNYQRLNKVTHELQEQHQYTNDAAARALLKLKARHYLKDNEDQQEQFDAFLKCTYPEQYATALSKLAPSEEIISRFGFSTDTDIHVLNVHVGGGIN